MKGLKMGELASKPSAPAPGKRLLYPKADGWYELDSDDNEESLKGDQGDQGPQGPQGPQGDPGTPGSQGPAGPMTTEAFISETSTVTLPNTTTPTVIYSDTENWSGGGNSYLDISLAVRPHSTGNDMEFFIRFDGVILTPEYDEEHKDTSTTQSMWRSQCFNLGNVSAGNHTIELLFSKEGTGGTAQLKNYTAKAVRYS